MFKIECTIQHASIFHIKLCMSITTQPFDLYENSDIFRVPWDQMTLSGYFKSASICLLCGPSFFIINFSFLPFFMGIGAHYPQFRYFFRDLIAEIGMLAKGQSTEYKKIRATLSQAVEFHNDVKE